MNTDKDKLGPVGGQESSRITEVIIGCAYTVGNTLGSGFLEKVYENALAHELRKNSLRVEQQKSVDVIPDGIVAGQYAVDLLVEAQIIVELKATRAIDRTHEAQLLNYLKATGLRVGLILNSGKPRVEVRRKVL